MEEGISLMFSMFAIAAFRLSASFDSIALIAFIIKNVIKSDINV
jgi:hypothetical protein